MNKGGGSEHMFFFGGLILQDTNGSLWEGEVMEIVT